MTPLSTRESIDRVRLGISVLILILIASTVGYHFLDPSEDREWIDDLYFVVITVSSVGYSEKTDVDWPVQLFTIGVIVFGMSAAAYTMGAFVQMITEGEIHKAMGVRRMTRDIQQLDGHVILCGYGRIGRSFCDALQRQGKQFVVIESDLDRVLAARENEHLMIQGNATLDEVLMDAGIERAKSVVTTLPEDALNVFLTLTARNMNEKLYIVARAEYPETKKKLSQAGGDRVVLPTAMGAAEMARLITHPSTVELMDLVFDREFAEVELDEITIRDDCSIIGQTVAEVGTHSRHGLLIVAIKRADGQLIFNPATEHPFAAGDTLLAMGKTADTASFRKQHSIEG
jgi:voltage-gated potassium channel